MPSHSFFNQILDLIATDIKREIELEPEDEGDISTGRFGDSGSEEEFEDKFITPLVKRWGFRSERQHPCEFQLGS